MDAERSCPTRSRISNQCIIYLNLLLNSQGHTILLHSSAGSRSVNRKKRFGTALDYCKYQPAMSVGQPQLVSVSVSVIVSVSVLAACLCVCQATDLRCRTPPINKRRMDADVRAESPFYVVAMTRTPRTEQIDNICYTYFENNDRFLHIISMVFKNGSTSQAVLYKHDVEDDLGIIEASGESCKYHDHTLMPLCNYQVFPLYRCFLSGSCSQLDAGPVPEVDVRLFMATDPYLPSDCPAEIARAFSDTTHLSGSDYVLLPQQLEFRCVTSYTFRTINHDNALGFMSMSQFRRKSQWQ